MPDTVEITHTGPEGTIATGDTREHREILKRHGFRWSRNLGAWYVPGSRDRQPQTWKVNAAAEELRAAGVAVTVELNLEQRPMTEREQARAERIDGRQDALASKAERVGARADATLERAREMASVIPLGQPMMPGHHSYRRDVNYRNRIDSTYRRGFEELGQAREAGRKAGASQVNERHREDGPTTMRRLERLEAERRDIARKLTPCPTSNRRTKPEAEGRTITCPRCYRDITIGNRQVPEHGAASGDWREQLEARAPAVADEITYWQAHLQELNESGAFRQYSRADVAKGDKIRTRFGWEGPVKRVNAKTVSVPSGYSWDDRISYDRILEVRKAADLVDDGPKTEGGTAQAADSSSR